MFNTKSLFIKVATLSLAASTMLCIPAIAATNKGIDSDNGIQKSIVETGGGTIIEGMVDGRTVAQDGVSPRWLAYGPLYQYPSDGGTWEYGFWNAKVRSYYTVDRCHGSTVQLNSKQSRSVDTASGKKSIAELWALQSDSNDKYYYRVCDQE